MNNKKSSGAAIALGTVGGIFITLCVLIGIYFSQMNKFNSLKQDCIAQYSRVESVMQRRYDLIPNLTEAVKGDMKQEKAVFGEIAKARKAYNSASSAKDKMAADEKINKSLNVLINNIHENYPKLNSDQRVRDLMIELEGSENRINVERKRYIDSVQTYNTAINKYPGKFFADVGGYHAIDYYQAEQGAQKAPKVKF